MRAFCREELDGEVNRVGLGLSIGVLEAVGTVWQVRIVSRTVLFYARAARCYCRPSGSRAGSQGPTPSGPSTVCPSPQSGKARAPHSHSVPKLIAAHISTLGLKPLDIILGRL